MAWTSRGIGDIDGMALVKAISSSKATIQAFRYENLVAACQYGSLRLTIADSQVDTGALANDTLTNGVTIADWYDAHYLSICSGMWNHHMGSAGRNGSTTVCWLQNTGYTFSIGDILDRNDVHHRAVQTKAPFILLVASIATMSLTILGFLYGIIIMARPRVKGQLVKHELPLVVLRVAFFATIASTILTTISSAKITASAGRSAGTFEVGGEGTVRASSNSGFLAIIWVETVLVWLGLALVLATAFRIGAALQDDKANPVKPGREWAHL